MVTRAAKSAEDSPVSPSHLVDVALWRAGHQPGETAYTYLTDSGMEERSLRYGELHRLACAIAGRLRSLVTPGERALLLYPAGLDFVAAFYGCLYAGVVAVPLALPRPNRPWSHFEAVWKDARPAVVLTSRQVLATLVRPRGESPVRSACPWVDTSDISGETVEAWQVPNIRPDTLALLQYTSGSTASPRGVMVSHANLAHNAALIHARANPTDPRYVMWLPHFHDMGLVAGIVEPMFVGIPVTLLSPMSFVQRPSRWLQAISRSRATLSGGPDFAYDLCVRKVTPEERAELDLSCWQVAFTGAEPIRWQTLDRFARYFEPCGFRRDAFFPCYGLAESTLLVTGGPRSRPPTVVFVQREGLEQSRVVTAPRPDGAARPVVGCGQVPPDVDVVIVDPQSRTPCPPGRVGEIWLSSPSVAQGYWNRPEESKVTFLAYLADKTRGPFLRTGDLGFLEDGELFVTGRLKDLLIVMGRNSYPQDIEVTVEGRHRALLPGCGAAFAIEAEGSERLVVVHEVARGSLSDCDVEEVFQAVRRAVAEEHDLDVYAVALLKPASIPKTSSGKIQRALCRSKYLAGTLDTVAAWRKPDAHDAREVSIAGELPPGQIERQALDRGSPRHTKEALAAWLRSRIAERVRVDPRDLDVQKPLGQYGLGSFEAVSLAGDLQVFLGRRVPPTQAWEYPTIDALAGYLSGESTSPVPGPVDAPVTVAPSNLIAVVGLGCRFPGAPDPDSFWRLLQGGASTVTEVPPDRWSLDRYYDPSPQAAGKMYTRHGSFLERVDLFDARFFGIAPREANSLDPQQRLLLEVVWEALEYGGESPQRLRGSRTGVFVGIGSHDYARRHLLSGVPTRIDAYSGTGSAASIAAGRVSYALGLQGPSLAIDTSCSSALVAVHLACQSLRNEECDMALAGGVSLMLSPENTIYLCKIGALSPAGLCRSFDAEADGYVRGEGCGVVVLKRLATALADRNQILGVIRGSAVNQDGRSQGLTAPNGMAQQAVIRDALRNARIEPADVDYVEAHGTGTKLGDPIEVRALAAALGSDRGPERKLRIGSVKANIGHLEAAAGVAGLIKVILALQRQELPLQPHVQTLNPAVSWTELGVTVPITPTPWPAGERRRIAGVSSFGFSGTNVHVVVEEAPEMAPERPAMDRPVHMLALSANDEQALTDLAARYDGYLRTHPGDSLADVCFTASAGRSQFPHRLAVVGATASEICAGLTAFRTGAEIGTVRRGRSQSPQGPRVAFVFTGAGAQLQGAGAELYDTQPVFRKALDRCDAVVRASVTNSLVRALRAADEAGVLVDEPACRDTALFSLEFALTELWTSWGVRPDVVLGCGIGEYAAACAAGVLTPEDALRMLIDREETKTPRLELMPESSDQATEGVKLILREPEDLSTAITKLIEQGCEVFVEIGPHPAVMEAAGSRESLAGRCWVASLHSGRDGWTPMLESLAALYVRGVPVDWAGFDRDYPRRRLALPTYPFQRERCWLDHADPQAPAASESSAVARIRRPVLHPLLGARVLSPALDAIVFEQELRASAPAFLDDHRVYDAALLPAATYLELALAGAAAAFGPGSSQIEQIRIAQGLVLSDEEPRLVQTIFRRVEATQATFQVVSLEHEVDAEPSSWQRHATGTIRIGSSSPERSSTEPISIAAMQARCSEELSRHDFYQALRSHGLNYGPSFQGVEQVWSGKGEALGRITLPDALRPGAEPYVLHPALLDACLQVVAATGVGLESGDAYVPVEFGCVRIHRRPVRSCWCRAVRRAPRDEEQGVVKADLVLVDGDGTVLVELVDLVCKRVSRAALAGGMGRDLVDCLYRIDWRSQESAYFESQREPGRWVILADRSGLADALSARLAEFDQTCHRVTRSCEYRASGSGDYTLDPSQPAHVRRLLHDVLQADSIPCRGVVHLWALDATPPEDTSVDSLQTDEAALCGGALHLVQGLANSRCPEPPRLCFVTRGAHALGADTAAVSPAQAPLGGLAAVIAAEHPDLHGLTVDLDPSGELVHDVEALVEELLTPSRENQVAIRKQRRHVPRLVRRRIEPSAGSRSLRADATYLITGGTGSLGLLVAQWMVERGARHLVLVGRRNAPDSAIGRLEEMERDGARIELMVADISRGDAAARVGTRLRALAHPLRGIVHAAGIVDDGILVQQDWARVASVLAPKVLGAWNLHTLSEGHVLDFFVLFSSAAAWLPSEGQGSYSAANAFLDALAHYRKAKGLPALSINWGPWEGTGMAGRAGALAWQRWRTWGISPIARREGLEVLECLLQGGDPQVGVLPIEWAKFVRRLPEGREPSLIAEIAEHVRSQLKDEALVTRRQDLLRQLSHASQAERQTMLAAFIQDQVVEILKLDPSQRLDASQALIEIGMDSMMAVELQHRIQAGLGLTLPATAGFDYPSVEALAGHLCDKMWSVESAMPGSDRPEAQGRHQSERRG